MPRDLREESNHSIHHAWVEISLPPPSKASDVVLPPESREGEEEPLMSKEKEEELLAQAANNQGGTAHVSVKVYVTKEYVATTPNLEGTVREKISTKTPKV